MGKKPGPKPGSPGHHAVFKKGVSPNPGGRPRLSAIAKTIIVTSREDLIRLYENCTNVTKEELLERLQDPSITILEESFLRAIVADMEVGDTKTLERMIERIHGKTIQPIMAQVGVITLEQLVSSSSKENEDATQAGKIEERSQLQYRGTREIGPTGEASGSDSLQRTAQGQKEIIEVE